MRKSLVLCIGVLMLLLAGCGQSQEPGMRIVLQADPQPYEVWPQDGMKRRKIMEEARDVMLRRVKQIRGVADPTVGIDEDKLVLSLPGTIDAAEAIAAATATSRGSLQFYYVPNLRTSRNPIADWSVTSVGDDYEFTGPENQKINSAKQPKEVLSQIIGAPKVKPVLSGADIMPDARANINTRNQIVISLRFNEQGKKVFADFTRGHVGEYLAIFYNGALLTCPVIQEPILDGSAEISGFKTMLEAKRAVDALNAGQLPVTFKVITKH